MDRHMNIIDPAHYFSYVLLMVFQVGRPFMSNDILWE